MSNYLDGLSGNPFAPGAGQIGYEQHLSEQRARMDAIKPPANAVRTRAPALALAGSTGNAPSYSPTLGTGSGYVGSNTRGPAGLHARAKAIADAVMLHPLWSLVALASIYFFGFSGYGDTNPPETIWQGLLVGAFITVGLYGVLWALARILSFFLLAVFLTLRWLVVNIVLPLALLGGIILVAVWAIETFGR